MYYGIVAYPEIMKNSKGWNLAQERVLLVALACENVKKKSYTLFVNTVLTFSAITTQYKGEVLKSSTVSSIK